MSVCGREKCAFKRKPYPPGEHGRKSKHARSISEYGMQMREKQRLKFTYGLREAQFRNYVKEAQRRGTNTTEALLQILESRLDNTVHRLGFAVTRSFARQLISHGHIMVNGRKVNIPSFRTRTGDVISIRPQSSAKGAFKDLEITLKKYNTPPWLALDKEKREGKVLGKADVADPSMFLNLKLDSIVEFYSR